MVDEISYDAQAKNVGPTKNCRYYNRGFCGYGDKCLFRHGGESGKLKLPRKQFGESNCKFFKKASCRFGAKCRFRHILKINGHLRQYPTQREQLTDILLPNQNEKLKSTDSEEPKSSDNKETKFPMRPQKQRDVSRNCYFYKQREGSCRFGEKCWYTHSEPQPSIPKCEYQHPSMVCFNFAFNECDLGDACPAPHGDVCDWCQLPLLHPSDEQQRDEHLLECEVTFLTDMDDAISYTNTVDSQCAICHDKVQEKRQIAKLTFGMQENCQHVFCLGCIREWKKKNPGCPICRVVSHFVVPIDYGYIASSEQQKRLLEAYKANCNQRPCKFFGRGRCRFGERCLYHHDVDHSQQIDPLDPNSSTSYHAFGEQDNFQPEEDIYEDW